MRLLPMRMRTVLLLALLSVSVGFTALSLAVVHSILKVQIHSELIADLHRSVLTFRNLQSQRREMLRHQAALLADLPSLKALMTSQDARTIQDGAEEFANVSGSSLFALSDASGHTVAVFVDRHAFLDRDLARALDLTGNYAASSRYLVSGSHLYDVSTEPLYFGPQEQGTRLGYVSTGYAIDDRLTREVREESAAEVVFSANGHILSSTLQQRQNSALATERHDLLLHARQEQDVWLGSEHYLATSVALTTDTDSAVYLIALKSYDAASVYLQRVKKFLIALGCVVLLLGAITALYIARSITRPLESLAVGAHALGSGNYESHLEVRGAREVRDLSRTFEAMRARLRQTQQDLLQAERFATIGRMASSISHDLRHYLSAVYANAEFLGESSTSPDDRAELMAEVRLGVEGMTDLIESLLFFSRTGQPLQLTCEGIGGLIERAVTLVRMHRESSGVTIAMGGVESQEIWVDGRKIERAIYNLLLNACQAAKIGSNHPAVRISGDHTEEKVRILVEDNGPGISQSVATTLFQPFVSEGKQSGVGLGLTIASRIAEEHGGKVEVELSEPGRTIFSLSILKRSSHIHVPVDVDPFTEDLPEEERAERG